MAPPNLCKPCRDLEGCFCGLTFVQNCEYLELNYKYESDLFYGRFAFWPYKYFEAFA